jgi:hypothetical protein
LAPDLERALLWFKILLLPDLLIYITAVLFRLWFLRVGWPKSDLKGVLMEPDFFGSVRRPGLD